MQLDKTLETGGVHWTLWVDAMPFDLVDALVIAEITPSRREAKRLAQVTKLRDILGETLLVVGRGRSTRRVKVLPLEI